MPPAKSETSADRDPCPQLAEQVHTQTYTKGTILRGRQQFLNYLENTGHRAMANTTSEEVIGWYRGSPMENLQKITEFLSHITPLDADNYLSIYTSKNQQRRKLILEIGDGRQIHTCVGHSAACNARSAAASCWRAVDQINKWTPNPVDPTRGSGCPFYHDRITRMLMNKAKLDLREGRGKVSAQLIYIEDHTQYLRIVIVREVAAYATLAEKLLQHATLTAAPDEPTPTLDTTPQHAYAAWAQALLTPTVVRFNTNAQREGGQRAEIANLLVSEVQVRVRVRVRVRARARARQG